jgi:acyl transferase domain-containing protein
LFYKGQNRKRIEVPTYAFDNKRHWVDPVQSFTATSISPSSPQNTKSPIVPVYSANIDPVQNIRQRKTILIEKLRDIFENASGIDTETMEPGTHFIELGFDSLLLTQVALNCKRIWCPY